MVTSSNASTLAGFLAASSGMSSGRGNPLNVNGFEEQLTAAIRRALEESGLSPNLVKVSSSPVSGQDSVANSAARQFVVTVDPASPAVSDAVSEKPPQAIDQQAPKEAPAMVEADPKRVLEDALQAAGMNPAQFEMSLWSETVHYPGGQFLAAGSYVNNFITVDLGSKGKINFSSDLTMRNPRVTVNEIQELLKT